MMKEQVKSLRTFLDAAHSVYHAQNFLKRRLEEAGYTRLPEQVDWRLTPGEKYYVERGALLWRRSESRKGSRRAF